MIRNRIFIMFCVILFTVGFCVTALLSQVHVEEKLVVSETKTISLKTESAAESPDKKIVFPENVSFSDKQRKKYIGLFNGLHEFSDGVSYSLTAVYSDPDGELMTEGFLINNTGNDIKNISGDFSIYSDAKVIAKAFFELSEDSVGILPDKGAMVCTLHFPDKYVAGETSDNTQSFSVRTDLKWFEITNTGKKVTSQ